MLKQITPTKLCLSCDICCRFIDKNAALAPVFLPHEITPKIKRYLDKSYRVKLKLWQDIHICPFFNIETHICAIYSKRPLDCQLYPFAVMFDEKQENVVLGVDTKCPFSANPENMAAIKNYFHYLAGLLEDKKMASAIAENPLFIGSFQEDVTVFSSLDQLTKLIINNPKKNGFRLISSKDKPVFDEHFNKSQTPDSSQNFVSLYIWKEKNPVWWKNEENNIKILIETDSGYIDFNSIKKFHDYIYLTKDLIELKGNRYRHKRASCNYFSKNYKFQYLPYRQNMKNGCLKLFSKWMKDRVQKSHDPYYHRLLGDSYSAHKLAIENFKALGLTGRVIKIKGRIAAYTFGFEITKDMFCVLLEVCDLKFKGISEFIFREFSRELSAYKYINTMDDSGLENLRISKLSYHPVHYHQS